MLPFTSPNFVRGEMPRLVVENVEEVRKLIVAAGVCDDCVATGDLFVGRHA